MKETEVPRFPCPTCGKFNDRATVVTNPDASPKPREFSVCIGCGEILRFTKRLTLRLCTEGELRSLHAEAPETYRLLMKAQFLVRFKRDGGKGGQP